MSISIPRWNQLPDIALYMDQVLLVMGAILEPLSAEVTSTMINNYVKMKLTPPPEKKKYTKSHVACFLMICLLKKVLSMTEIDTLKNRLFDCYPPEEGYDLFCRELELRVENLDGADSPDCPPLLAAAVRAVACKIRVEQILSEKAEEN